MPKDNLPEIVSAWGELESQLDALPTLDIEQLADRTISRILTASSPDEVLANPEPTGLGTFAGDVVILHSITGCMPSAFTTGPSRYIVLDITDEHTGEQLSVTCGSPYVIAAAFALQRLGELPTRCRVLALDSKSNPGQKSLWIVKV
jgi:hypothetical protein